MGNRIAPAGGTRISFALLAFALVASLVQVVSIAPAQALPTDQGPAIVPGADTSGLQDSEGQWDSKNQHRIWFNTDGNRWDAVLPASVASGATVPSAWMIAKGVIPGSLPAATPVYGPQVTADPQHRPDAYWDQATNTLYVLVSGSTTQFFRYSYNTGTDIYTQTASVTLTGMNAEEARAVIYKVGTDLFASVMNGDGLFVTRSTDNGGSWATPTNLILPVAEGQTQLTSFVDGATYLAVAAAEDGDADLDGGRLSRYLFYKLDLANVANWNLNVKAFGTLTVATQPGPGTTITIGDRVYNFQNAPLPVAPGNVLIGVDVAATRNNLAAAVGGTGTPGVEYSLETIPHGTVTMTAFNGSGVATVTAKEAGAGGNAIATLPVGGNGFATGTLLNGNSGWTSETVPLQAGANVSGITLHSDDELSLVTYQNTVYMATETQRTGGTAAAELDAQVVLFRRAPGNPATGNWIQSNVKMDQPSSEFDRKRPVVAIMDDQIYVIAINNPRTSSAYFRVPLASIPNLGGGWGTTNELFNTEFERYRNNIVPRERVIASQRLPILI
ncbi:MAG: hypothetical protein WEE53_02395, partial [Acidimicrobiia bacterium]